MFYKQTWKLKNSSKYVIKFCEIRLCVLCWSHWTHSVRVSSCIYSALLVSCECVFHFWSLLFSLISHSSVCVCMCVCVFWPLIHANTLIAVACWVTMSSYFNRSFAVAVRSFRYSVAVCASYHLMYALYIATERLVAVFCMYMLSLSTAFHVIVEVWCVYVVAL